MQTLKDLVQEGKPLPLPRLKELAKKLEEFKKTDVYEILLIINNNAIKRHLSIGSQDNAERQLGKLEGIQEAFENRIRLIILDADRAVKAEKDGKKMNKELGEDEDLQPDKE